MAHANETEEAVLRSELMWTAVVTGVVTVIMLAIIYAGLVHHINPPSNIETIDPKTLHLTGEFTEGNLGTRVEPNGQVTSRIVDRKSTRLNSSHANISYAVFCLKKKKKINMKLIYT